MVSTRRGSALALVPDQTDAIMPTATTLTPAALPISVKPTKAQKRDLQRIAFEFERRNIAIEAGRRTAKHGTQAIVDIHLHAHQVMVPALEQIADSVDQPRSETAQTLVLGWTNLLVEDLVGSVRGNLRAASNAIIGITGNSFDLAEDTRGPLRRLLEGDRR